MRRIFPALILLVTSIGFTLGQTKEYKNPIYGNVGTIPVTIGVGTVNIERYIFSTKLFVPGNVSIRLGYGEWGSYSSSGEAYLGTLNFITGHRKSHFELGFGPAILIDRDNELREVELPDGSIAFQAVETTDLENSLGVNVGYRYTSKFFMFRGGISWPETIYIGLGVAF